MNDKTLLRKAIARPCESMKERFAILDVNQGIEDISKVDYGLLDSSYAAYYYPWIKVYNTIGKYRKQVPPGGHVAGIYARSDLIRGAHKAPANENVVGALELEFPISKQQQGILYSKRINVLMELNGR